ncbi:MAG: hypothetical protein Q4C01_06290 [Clostridia bacterium]|nr:hypothetical protein [Clostridia bacterium]
MSEYEFEFAFCIFCASGHENRTVEAIEREFSGAKAYFATFEREERKDGVWYKRTLPLISGYVFVYSNELLDVLRLKRTIGVYRLLQYEDGEYALRGSDLDFAKWIWTSGGNIGLSKAIKKGSRVEIVSGPLARYAGVIKDVNNQRRSALVEIEVGEMKRDVWLSFEWL